MCCIECWIGEFNEGPMCWVGLLLNWPIQLCSEFTWAWISGPVGVWDCIFLFAFTQYGSLLCYGGGSWGFRIDCCSLIGELKSLKVILKSSWFAKTEVAIWHPLQLSAIHFYSCCKCESFPLTFLLWTALHLLTNWKIWSRQSPSEAKQPFQLPVYSNITGS